jgi:hypothetical protein
MGNYLCYGNELTTLEGAPEYVGGVFVCDNNKVSVKALYKTVQREYLK